MEQWKILTSYEVGDDGLVARAEGLVRGAPEEVWDVVIDVAHWKDIFSKVTKSQEISKSLMLEILSSAKKSDRPPDFIEGWEKRLRSMRDSAPWERRPGERWVSYLFEGYSFPWPIDDRWAVEVERRQRIGKKAR